MLTASIQHEFDCDDDTLWHLCLFDDDYSRRLYIETLGFPIWRLKERLITDETLVRTVEIQPLLEDLSGPIRSVVGNRFAYVEHGTFDRKAKYYRFRITPNVLPEKTDITGDMYTERLGDRKVRRVINTRVQVNVFAVGRVIEQRTIDDTKASHERIAAFTRKYLTEKQGRA
jgi:hypothetical protein